MQTEFGYHLQPAHAKLIHDVDTCNGKDYHMAHFLCNNHWISVLFCVLNVHNRYLTLLYIWARILETKIALYTRPILVSRMRSLDSN